MVLTLCNCLGNEYGPNRHTAVDIANLISWRDTDLAFCTACRRHVVAKGANRSWIGGAVALYLPHAFLQCAFSSSTTVLNASRVPLEVDRPPCVPRSLAPLPTRHCSHKLGFLLDKFDKAELTELQQDQTAKFGILFQTVTSHITYSLESAKSVPAMTHRCCVPVKSRCNRHLCGQELLGPEFVHAHTQTSTTT